MARNSPKAHPAWRVAQWATTGLAGRCQYRGLPPASALHLSSSSLQASSSLVWAFSRMGGERSEIVDEKSSVVDVRAATVIFIRDYSLRLQIVQHPNEHHVGFVGLLGGREIAMAFRRK